MSIKILVTYHDQHPILRSDILMPIQTGAAVAPLLFDGMLRDDDGENISNRNDKFSELSAMYWAWKNYDKIGTPDYIGFMHYRRQFVFDERLALPYPKWISSFYFVSSLNIAKAYFSDESIKKTIQEYDYLIPKYHVTPTKNIREEYDKHIPGSHVEIFDTFIQICREIIPDWEEEICQIETGNIVSVCNMFVMKKQLFFDYCDFAFPILFELEKRINADNYTENGKRFLGYMAEKLQAMYTFRLEKNPDLKEKFLNCVYVRPDVQRSDIRVQNPVWKNVSKWMYFRYKLLAKITWGRRRKHYKQKRREAKAALKNRKERR